MVFEKVRVIDGGFATQLSVYVGESVDGDPLWSARFNSTAPQFVIESHLDFFKGSLLSTKSHSPTIKLCYHF